MSQSVLFASMDLPEQIKVSLAKMNFLSPTPVQAKVIPAALEGIDLVSSAETGSGKTAAFAIPIVKSLMEDPTRQALIMTPTRELAQQVADFFRDLISESRDLQVVTLVGGADIRKQLKYLKNKPQIIVATPGRLNDHLKRRSIRLETTKILVLDEGDRMLDMGFAPQIDQVLKFMPQERQTMLFTATLPPKLTALVKKYLKDPIKIQVGESSQPVKKIKQSVLELSGREKNDKIIDELNKRQGSVIIFLRTKHRTSSLMAHLSDYGFEVGQIHGGCSQGQRNRAIQNFRDGQIRILCATDVAARGIDVPHVEHVINFDLPMQIEDYVHRIGRTGRNGATGEAVSFVTPEDRRSWMMIAKEFRIPGVELSRGAATSASSSRPLQRGGERDYSSGGRPERRGSGGGGGYRSEGRGRPAGPRSDAPRFVRSRPEREERRSGFASTRTEASRPERTRTEQGGGVGGFRSSRPRSGGGRPTSQSRY